MIAADNASESSGPVIYTPKTGSIAGEMECDDRPEHIRTWAIGVELDRLGVEASPHDPLASSGGIVPTSALNPDRVPLSGSPSPQDDSKWTTEMIKQD